MAASARGCPDRSLPLDHSMPWLSIKRDFNMYTIPNGFHCQWPPPPPPRLGTFEHSSLSCTAWLSLHHATIIPSRSRLKHCMPAQHVCSEAHQQG